MQFPTNPISGDIFKSDSGVEYMYDATKRIWIKQIPTPDLTVDTTNTAIAVSKIWTGTKAEYDSLPTKYPDVLYFVQD